VARTSGFAPDPRSPLAITNGGWKSRSLAASSSTSARKDNSTRGKNRSNPSSKRIRPTYLDPSMKNMASPTKTTHHPEDIQYDIENQIENIEKTIQDLT